MAVGSSTLFLRFCLNVRVIFTEKCSEVTSFPSFFFLLINKDIGGWIFNVYCMFVNKWYCSSRIWNLGISFPLLLDWLLILLWNFVKPCILKNRFAVVTESTGMLNVSGGFCSLTEWAALCFGVCHCLRIVDQIEIKSL